MAFPIPMWASAEQSTEGRGGINILCLQWRRVSSLVCIVLRTDQWLWIAFVLQTYFRLLHVLWNSVWGWLYFSKERKGGGLIDTWSQQISDRDKTITSASIWKIISRLWKYLTWFKSVPLYTYRYRSYYLTVYDTTLYSLPHFCYLLLLL